MSDIFQTDKYIIDSTPVAQGGGGGGGGDLTGAIADIVNVYGSKNLNVYPYLYKGTAVIDGITYTINNDGTITANNSASADSYLNLHQMRRIEDFSLEVGKSYYISGGISNSAQFIIAFADNNRTAISGSSAVSTGGSTQFTVPNSAAYATIFIYIKKNASLSNAVFKPMIRCASIQDDTYEPYVPTNRQLLSHKDNGILGAKNLLPNTATSKTVSGVTFTVNNSNKNITVNGTATADIYYDVGNGKFDSNTYILSGCPSGGASNKYFLVYYDPDGHTYDYGIEKMFVGDGDTHSIQIVIKNGQTLSNAVFKPMIRLASDSDNTYQPYAKTNKQLTDDTSKSELLNLLHPVGTIIESTTCDTMAKVVAAYGGTTWKQHTGYVLRGASSGVVADSNVKTGGSDDAIVVKHSHTTPNHSHTFTGTAANYNSGNVSADHIHTGVAGTDGAHTHCVTSPTGHSWGTYYGNLGGTVTFTFAPATVNTGCYAGVPLLAESNAFNYNSAHAHSVTTNGISANHYHTTTVTPYGTIGNANPTTNETGSAGTNANIPNYKSVYIWERTA